MKNIVLFIAGFVGGTLAVIISLLAARYDLKLDTALGALGVIVGVLGVVFAAYFGVLAVDAFGHLKVLKDSTEQASAAVAAINTQTADVTALKAEATTLSDTIYNAGDHLFVTLAAFVTSMPRGSDTQKRKLEKLAEEIVLWRAKMALTNHYISEDDIRTHVLTILDKGSACDCGLIDKLLASGKYQADLTGFLRQSLKTLERKP